MAQVFRGDDLATIEFCGSKRALWAQSDRMSAGGTLEELWKSGRQGNLDFHHVHVGIGVRGAGNAAIRGLWRPDLGAVNDPHKRTIR